VKRASTVVTETLQANPNLVADVISDALTDPNASDHLKLRATKLALQIESNEEDRARQEDERLGRSRGDIPADREAIAEALAAKLASSPILAAELSAVLARAAALAGDSSQDG
jgi:hypothetical protein